MTLPVATPAVISASMLPPDVGRWSRMLNGNGGNPGLPLREHARHSSEYRSRRSTGSAATSRTAFVGMGARRPPQAQAR